MDRFRYIRGQVITTDLMSATVVALLAFSTLSIGYEAIESENTQRQMIHAHMGDVSNALDRMIYTPGVPQDWERQSTDDVLDIGLAKNPHSIDDEKLKSLMALDEKTLSELTGLRHPRFCISSKDGVRVCVGADDDVENQILAKRTAYQGDRTVLVELSSGFDGGGSPWI